MHRNLHLDVVLSALPRNPSTRIKDTCFLFGYTSHNLSPTRTTILYRSNKTAQSFFDYLAPLSPAPSFYFCITICSSICIDISVDAGEGVELTCYPNHNEMSAGSVFLVSRVSKSFPWSVLYCRSFLGSMERDSLDDRIHLKACFVNSTPFLGMLRTTSAVVKGWFYRGQRMRILYFGPCHVKEKKKWVIKR